eukprot:553385-Hanusia_phi.AAC.1
MIQPGGHESPPSRTAASTPDWHPPGPGHTGPALPSPWRTVTAYRLSTVRPSDGSTGVTAAP